MASEISIQVEITSSTGFNWVKLLVEMLEEVDVLSQSLSQRCMFEYRNLGFFLPPR